MRLPEKYLAFEDAAKRIADQVNMHRTALGQDAEGKWCSFALDDGRSPTGELYDTKSDAIRHVPSRTHYAFICIQPEPMTVLEAAAILRTQRLAYDQGFDLRDPNVQFKPDIVR